MILMQYWSEPRADRSCKSWWCWTAIWLRQVGRFHFYSALSVHLWLLIKIKTKISKSNPQEKPNIEDVACDIELPKNSADEDNHNCFWHFLRILFSYCGPDAPKFGKNRLWEGKGEKESWELIWFRVLNMKSGKLDITKVKRQNKG